MRKFILLRLCIACVFCLFYNFSFPQKDRIINGHPDTNDTVLLSEYAQLQANFIETYKDSAFYYGHKALAIARKLDQKYYEGFILCDLAYNYISIGDYTNALKYLIDATKLSEDKALGANIVQTPFIGPYLQKDAETNRKELTGWIKNSLGILYGATVSEDKKLDELLQAKWLVENEVTDMFLLAGICSNIMEVYLNKNELDSALYYQKLTMQYESKTNRQTYNGVSFAAIGEIFSRQRQTDSAKKYLFEARKLIKAQDENLIGLGATYISLANLYYDANQPDSGIYYASQAVVCFRLSGPGIPEMLDAYTALALNYNKNKQYDSAYKYMALSKNISDSLNGVQLNNLGKFHNMGFEEKLRLKELENASVVAANRNRIFLLSLLVIVFFVIAFILYRNNKAKQRTNKILQEALVNLKSAQAQLIQSEKMASLGELTAGIAHEIQNPLNFVNNFSEVNKELINELKEELKAGNTQDAFSIADDIKANEEKINYHGKRADSIVKGMLQHSRTSSGQKELTDINALCDEYLRLSYHGLRAKDKSFNVVPMEMGIKTDFDETIGKINIVSQDIGRVLLNLINNAFYAVSKPPSPKGEQYKPLVIVTTRKIKPENTNAAKNTPLGDGGIEIRVTDNGNGIPKSIKDKIFQPFFTTKPTGSGTGLGLSLSYDIIKAHGGEIKAESIENEGTTFTIQLPVS